jgi:hypothetical protein
VRRISVSGAGREGADGHFGAVEREGQEQQVEHGRREEPSAATRATDLADDQKRRADRQWEQ